MRERRINNTNDELAMNFNAFVKERDMTFAKRFHRPCKPWMRVSAKEQLSISSTNCSKDYSKRGFIANQRVLFLVINLFLISSIATCAVASKDGHHGDSGRLPIDGGGKPGEISEEDRGSLYFDSRIHLPDDRAQEVFDPNQLPTVPEPNLKEELREDFASADDYNYYYGNDTLATESVQDLMEEFYRGPGKWSMLHTCWPFTFIAGYRTDQICAEKNHFTHFISIDS